MQASLIPDSYISDAVFSPCRTWRYRLRRIWDTRFLPLNVVGLNPSTADETRNDPTVSKCIRYARRWGYGGLIMSNLFAYRSTDPKGLLKIADPIGPENLSYLMKNAGLSAMVLVAWGTNAKLDKVHVDRVLQQLPHPLYCLGISKGGYPIHPLYQRDDRQPMEYTI